MLEIITNVGTINNLKRPYDFIQIKNDFIKKINMILDNIGVDEITSYLKNTKYKKILIITGINPILNLEHQPFLKKSLIIKSLISISKIVIFLK